MRMKDILRITAVLACLCTFPALAFAGACVTESVSSLMGTSCSIGDVEYGFGGLGGLYVAGVSGSSLVFTPDGSNPLDPSFTITGPLSVSATGLGNSTNLAFTFFWSATVIPSGLEIGSATNMLNGASVPGGPSYGFVDAGNNVGIPIFTNAIVQTGGPNANPSSALEDVTNIPLDGIFFGMYVQDGTGNGATTSLTSTDYQYFLVPTPEPSSLVLLGAGILGLSLFVRRHI
jgi:hypothetical protein